MSCEMLADGGLDYAPCRYGKSRTVFRGPKKRLDQPFIAVLGGTEAYGKFIRRPFPELMQDRLGIATVNFGCVNAGLDVHLNDPVVMQACSESVLTVVQITGAQNMSNRFYTVHPRRNDRFLKASAAMQSIWVGVDFTEIHFTRHLLTTLSAAAPKQFDLLREELSQAWQSRMRSLIRGCAGRVMLLWMSDRPPEHPPRVGVDAGPLFVDREMIETLRPEVIDIVEVVSERPFPQLGAAGKVFAPLDRMAAESLPGPDLHEKAAELLAERVPTYL